MKKLILKLSRKNIIFTRLTCMYLYKLKIIETYVNIVYFIDMDEFLTNFGKKIRYYRNICGFTQEELGELSDLSTNTINTLENGKSFTEYKNIKKLSKVLNIPEADLFDFKTSEPCKNELLKQVTARANLLNKEQQKQLIEIIKTFNI